MNNKDIIRELSQIPYVFIRKRRKNEKIKEWILNIKRDYDEYKKSTGASKESLFNRAKSLSVQTKKNVIVSKEIEQKILFNKLSNIFISQRKRDKMKDLIDIYSQIPYLFRRKLREE